MNGLKPPKLAWKNLLEFLYEIRWIIVSVFLISTIWFENAHITKMNKEYIGKIQIQLKELDEDVDRNTTQINIIEEKVNHNFINIQSINNKLGNWW